MYTHKSVLYLHSTDPELDDNKIFSLCALIHTHKSVLYLHSTDPELDDIPPGVSECTMGADYLSYFNQCFRLVKESSTYEEARAVCEEDGTTLATIKDGYEEAFVETLMYTNGLRYVWIGLTDKVQK